MTSTRSVVPGDFLFSQVLKTVNGNNNQMLKIILENKNPVQLIGLKGHIMESILYGQRISQLIPLENDSKKGGQYHLG